MTGRLAYLDLNLVHLKVKVKVMHILSAKMATDFANIDFAIKNEVTFDYYILDTKRLSRAYFDCKYL